MLQSTVYEPRAFWRWWKRTDDFGRVQTRRQLVVTKAARLLLLFVYGLMLLQLAAAITLLVISFNSQDIWTPLLALVLFLGYPFVLPVLLSVLLVVARKVIKNPRDKKLLDHAAQEFRKHPGTVIAVAGSYGKTTMKEILKEVLSQGGKTAATPGNMNVPVSLARFANSLEGDEKFVVVEFGEGYKGDVARMSDLVDPDVGIITGLAPNHLDEYETLENVASDLFSLSAYLKHENTYVAGDNEQLAALATHGEVLFAAQGLEGWDVKDVKSMIEGLSFTLKKGKKELKLKSQLVGRHLCAPLALAAVLADSFGISRSDIEAGVAATRPFEHRLQPRNLHGAWIIDDTYNGNLEGMRAGLALLAELKTPGKKIYVTPGLVDQGEETGKVHRELGGLIKKANPDRVVLMKNSVTDLIKEGLGDYNGELKVVNDPLGYYQNLEMILAGGDVVLLQNDWTDNYA